MKRLTKSVGITICLFLVFIGTAANRVTAFQDKPGTEREHLFCEQEFKAHMNFLAHDLLEGRAVGVRGGELAAEYIAAQFQALGLKPISEKDGYFQQVPMMGITTNHDSLRFTLSSGDNSVDIAPVNEVVINCELLQDHVSLEDDLLFVGYGIEAPEFDWDDYKGTDVRGKVLVFLVNDPDLEKTGFYNESLSYYGRWTYKEEIARIKGAKGIIKIHTDETATYPFGVVQASWAIERVGLKGEISNPLMVNGWISQPAIEKALAFVDLSFETLKEKADSRDFKPFPLGIKLKVDFEQTYREFTSPNVIGILPGASMADEVVIFMGHYDHLGVGRAIDGDNIYNGAVDNASGTAAVICLARVFASQPATKRSILFMAVTGEESGLLGSEFYSAHPVFPLEKTVVALNKDCCNFYGRRDGFSAFPIRYTNAIPLFEKLGEEFGLKLHYGGVDRGGGAFRSDHFPFSARGSIALNIGLAGKNLTMTDEEIKAAREKIGRWYHQPNDEVYPFWRYDGVIQEMELLYHLGSYFADGAEPPQLDPENPFKPAIKIRSMKYTRGDNQ